jgi:DNA gyrase subunit A
VVNELENSFLEYSMSVIISRALPDVRDGLKPVHRRILYSLYEQGIKSDTPHKKSARVVGDVMGKYHPHGDSSIYEALVRLAQPWSMSEILIDGHGNFGSPDDGPAAMRYTECRLSKIAMYMLDELNEDTVDFRDNYDQTEIEPESLPSSIPNLLVNGSTGIAVGMATNMPPHNLAESINAIIYMIKHPNVKLDKLLSIIPGPDLPTGGVILYDENLIEAYKTGRGSFKIRSKYYIDKNQKRDVIVVTELPYLVGPEKIISKIKDLVNNKKIDGIYDIKDLSDRKTGLRLTIEVRQGYSSEKVINSLFSLSPLQESFSINNVALVRGEPKTLSLIDIISNFINYRIDTIKRRSQFRLNKAQSRLHIVDGILVALKDIEKVILIIKSAKDSTFARNRLIKEFSLSETQATAILDMTLRRITSIEVTKLTEEKKMLEIIIKDLLKLLSSDDNIKKLIIEELNKINDLFPSIRRTLLVETNNIDIPKNNDDNNSIYKISISDNRYIIKNIISENSLENQGNNLFINNIISNGNDLLYFISNFGKIYSIKNNELPTTANLDPIEISDYLLLDKNEYIVGIHDGISDVIMVTKYGMIKKISNKDYKKRNGSTVIKLKNPDQLVSSFCVSDNSDNIFIGTSSGNILNIISSSVPYQQVNSFGVKAIKLLYNDFVVSADKISYSNLIIVTNQNNYLIFDKDELPKKGRGTKGVRCIKLNIDEVVTKITHYDSNFSFYNEKFKKIKLKITISKRDKKSKPLDSKFTHITF